MVDENAREAADLLQVIALGCADALNLKPVRVGGLTKAARIRDLALAAGLMILVDEPQGSDLATGGMVQLAATIDPDSFLATSFFMGEHMPMSYRPQGRARPSGPDARRRHRHLERRPRPGPRRRRERLRRPVRGVLG